MQERARQRELRNAGVVAAREARQKLAQAMALLDVVPVAGAGDAMATQLAAELASAVGALYGCEVGEASSVLDKLRAASGVLSGVLARVHGPASGSQLDAAGELVAASLAVLYPVRAGLERELAEPRPTPQPARRKTFTVRGASVQARDVPTMAEALPPEEQAELDAVRVLASQAGATVLDLDPPVHVDEPVVARTIEPPPRPPSVRPVPLVASRPPPEVQTLLTMASEAPLDPSRSSMPAAALFPEAGDEELPPLLLMDRKSGRQRRRAVELVADARGELVDATSGEHRTFAASDRRGQTRVDLEVDIGLHSASQFYAGLSNDISEGGIFVSTIRPLPVGSELEVSFVLPGGHTVTTRGRVAWLATPRDEDSRSGMGVRFVRLEPEHRAAIERFLQYRPPMLHEL
ncbi:MAG: TIGR02266 family protein [Sandaracinaceae bacterium]|nr:TIGR02266 family protein [Sandaracinaceae bacterium]